MPNIIYLIKTVSILFCVYFFINRIAWADIKGLSCPVIKQPITCVASVGKIRGTMGILLPTVKSSLELERYRASNETFRQGLEKRRLESEIGGRTSKTYFQEIQVYKNGITIYRARYQKYKRLLKVLAKTSP